MFRFKKKKKEDKKDSKGESPTNPRNSSNSNTGSPRGSGSTTPEQPVPTVVKKQPSGESPISNSPVLSSSPTKLVQVVENKPKDRICINFPVAEGNIRDKYTFGPLLGKYVYFGGCTKYQKNIFRRRNPSVP